MASLRSYHSKRDFAVSREPRGKRIARRNKYRFVIQRHAATRLHYDLRLELNGVYKSWAVTKTPSLDPAVKWGVDSAIALVALASGARTTEMGRCSTWGRILGAAAAIYRASSSLVTAGPYPWKDLAKSAKPLGPALKKLMG